MHRWARITIVALVVFGAGTVWWGTQPWSDHQLLVTPPEVGTVTASFRCAAPLDAEAPGEPEGPAREYPLSREPCRDQGQRRTLVFFDLGVVAVAGLGVIRWGRSPDSAN